MRGFNIQQFLTSLPRISPFVGGSSQDHFHGASGSSWEAVASSSSCVSPAIPRLRSDIDTAYSSSVGSYFSLKNVELQPSCVALPRSAEDVSAAIRTLSLGAHVWKDQCQFGIRGGGHTPFKGAASLDGGIVLDLIHMPSAGLSPDHETITVSPSTAWDTVYDTLAPYNRSAVGTKVSGVGVGGSATACGVSYLSFRYGYICDMVENFEVVLATGDIVNANAENNPDLWKALRGGGNNLGVVTALTLKTVEQGPFWGGQTFHSFDLRKKVFAAHVELANSYPYDQYAHFMNTLILNNNTRSWAMANSLQYTKSDPPVPEPKVFKPFLDLPQTPLMPGIPPNTLRVDEMPNYAREYDASKFGPKRWSFAMYSFAPDADFMEEFVQMTDEAMKPFVGLPGFLLSLNLQAVPTVMSERRGAVDSLGPIQTQGNVILIHWALAVDEEAWEHDNDITNAMQELFAAADKKAKKMNVYRTYTQATYADYWQNPFEARSKSTVEELVRTSKKYDPLRVFQKQVPGGFKLPEL
ncbi:hypothetical protein M409DRAFT_62416 [Zasmidium cellare ATCC 36951]|uniref:FAD-binding PCMH-type domain-containing protein n=1 Tax=Zasmidium cellare ATCC 36951 TaxID=1080233 RepID=A0A6A6D0F5_ZASCE|nr:uncharacterized protein M409DRAFT_62416 [Zasmidium cellare ATCC 36951]KAF2172665.1 hypothetical protein M409DRAFT_62416 [Zasmidium cellare ATCC 36951]